MIEEREIPKSWIIASTNDICLKITDGSHFSPKSCEDGYPYVTVKDIKNDRIDFNNCLKISEEDFIKLKKNDCQPLENDLLFSKDGTVGKVAIVNFNKDFVVLSSIAILRTDTNLISPKFLFHILKSNKFLRKALDQKKGVAIRRLILRDLKELELVLPPLAEQHRIVARIEELFSSLDKGIEALKTAQQQLKVYRQAVLKYAFEGRLTHPNLQEGELPEGWVVTTLGQVTIKSSEKVYPDKSSTFDFLGMDSIEPHTTKPIVWHRFSEMKSAGNKFKVNQVLYGRMRPYLNKTYLADRDGVASGEFIVLDCNNILPIYLLNILHHRDFVQFANSKTTGDRPRVTYDELTDYKILLPNPEEQRLIVQEIESRLSVCDKIEENITQSLQQAEALRQSILKKAFEGKLVHQDPSDEPASVLLERIKAERAGFHPQDERKVKMKRTKKEKL